MLIDKVDALRGKVKICFYKILYHKKFFFKTLPNMLSKTYIRIYKNAYLNVGENLTVRRNAIIRILKNAKLEIGNNVFLNDNISIK